MRFEMPETLDGLSLDELNQLHKAAWEEYTALATKDDVEITDADLADLDQLDQHLGAITALQTTLEAAAAERATKLAAARGKVEAVASAPDPEPEPAEEAETEQAPQGELSDDAHEEDAVETEKEPVMASAASSVAKAASRAVAIAPARPVSPSVLIAAANLPGIASQEEFEDFSHVARVFNQKAAKGPSAGSSFKVQGGEVYGLSKDHTRQGLAKIKKSPLEFSVDMAMSAEQQLKLIDEAASEARLSGGSLAQSVLAAGAAGGWCAPSETVYDFCSYETVTGLIDIPSLNIQRGGLRFTKGPDYSTIAANWGFTQTEAQAEAGTAKTCYAVECPPFEDHRLDAVGFCITAGILTEVGYPELVRRVLEIGATAHAHKVNKYVIDAIVAAAGTAVNAAEQGSATADLLDALSMQAWRIRTQYAMGAQATIEVVLPTWAKPVIQADLALRTATDIEFLSITDAMINAFFSARNLRVQFVEDFQTLTSASTSTWTKWPADVTALLYPAGAFVKGQTDVIDLDTIYDSVNITTNQYTAAFFEEGVMVINRCASAVAVQVGLDYAGRTGAADITAAIVP